MPNDESHAPRSSAETNISLNTRHIGRVFEDRYEILEWIGSGGYGDVWKAKDRIVGEDVAFKWMHAALGAVQPRVRREITILRLLRFPGVVRLIDDGVADDKPFLVMELVNGTPFPGISANEYESNTWAQLAGPTLALLETLSHVHATGVIHRDLKPDNVLVRPDGRPVVLDFGISQLHTPGSDLLRSGMMAGSPLYMAPEQISSGALDARVDLYAIGIMLYEALTGHIPHQSNDLGTLWKSRLSEAVRPVQELAPTLPADVASVIDKLLATRVEDRFNSAADVLAKLRGETMTNPTMFSFLGPQEQLADVTNALQQGQSMDIVGPHGSGRTRWLHEIANGLAGRGRTVAWIYPSKLSLGSLLPLVGEPTDAHRLRLDEALVWAENALSQLLENGTILLVDNAEQIDAWSADILTRCRTKPRVAIVRAFLTAPAGIAAADIVTIPLLDPLSLHSLFAGPDRLFHLREDAAQALWERTHGHPGQIELELLSWTRMGLARRDGHTLVVDREALGRLQTGLVGVRIPKSADSDFVLDDALAKDVLQWLSLAGCPLSMTQLATLLQNAPFRIEAACQGLLQRRMVKTSGKDHYEVRWRIPFVQDETQRLRSHQAIAFILSPGDDMRLYHLLAAGLSLEAAQESVIVAARHAKAGNIGAAIALLAEGLRAARDERAIVEETRILVLWAKTALAEGTPRAMDRVLYELSRTRSTDPTLTRLQPLLRAAIAAPGAGGMIALEMADALGSFSDPELERWRHRIRVTAVAVRAEAPLIAEVLHEVDDWVDQSDEPLAELTLAEGRARQRYHEGRFEDAAALYVRAADLETSTPGRIDAMLRSASALLEAFRHDEAVRVADEARIIAARFRNPYWEGRAEWLLRSAQYRTGQTQGADVDLIHAIALVGTDDLEALVCLNEAAAAMRAEHIDQAQNLADRAATIWRSMGRPYATMIARALAITSGATTDREEVQMLATRAMTCKGSGIGIQTLGLLGKVFPEMVPEWQHAIDGLVNDVPKHFWACRMDVLSVNEALAHTRLTAVQ